MTDTPGDKFVFTAEHMALLQRMYVGWDDTESGAPAIDPKRPYGNSSVADDIAKILDWPVQREFGPTDEQCERAETIHRETATALQIVLVTQMYRLGTYRQRDRYDARSWYRVEES